MSSCCSPKPEATVPLKLFQKIKPYHPLIIMVALVLLASTLISLAHDLHWMPLFMGLFFLNFSMFKLFDLSGFAKSFAMYDIIGSKSALYSKAYPFIELALACAYLTSFSPSLTNIITLIIMLTGLTGIIRTKRSDTQTKCACMGNLIDVPVGTITILENTSMAVMALLMLV